MTPPAGPGHSCFWGMVMPSTARSSQIVERQIEGPIVMEEAEPCQ